MNVGIIGFGKMGQLRAETVLKTGRGKVVKIFDFAESFESMNYPVASSAEEIVNDPSIDAVFICTPNYLNKPLTIASLKANKHVFCEKPPAITPGDVEDIRKSEKESGKKLMYGFNHRHHGSIQHMKNLINSQRYGKVLWMRGRYGKSVDKSFYDNWRSKREFAGGGILLDQGIHMLDLFLYLGGDFDDVSAFVSNCYWKGDIEDNVFAILKNSENNLVASLHSTMTQWRHLFSLEVFLEKGYMVLNGLRTSSQTYGDEVLSIAKNRTTAPAATWEDEERITYDIDNSWRMEVEDFFDNIENDQPIIAGNSADALRVMKLIDAIYKSDQSYPYNNKNA
jgi:1,5-anhydro-D-fructose reductase (1,5-anhydro-D-mannitol-forming)